MKKIRVEMEHCYGIKKLRAEFDFEANGNVFAVYAPNGVMKTSFANVFRDLSLGTPSSDRVWPTKTTTRVIVDENNKELPREGVFVIDDIADSFDYKNKYAIIEYLKEIAEEAEFRQIILSHNFDFYRTVSGRLQLKRKSRMFASKTNEEVFLQEELYQKSPFAHWRANFSDNTMLIASIPFLRNLAEFSGDDASFLKLTSLLHIKSDTDDITVGNLETLIKTILHDQATLALGNAGSKVRELIHSVASQVASDASESHALENKVVLSIAIRLKAEEIMIQKINDAAFCAGIETNQTIALIKRFKSDFPLEREAIQLFEQVNLMTPENIHLNSFMYEPILDLSAQHLKKLYLKLIAIA